MIISRIERRVRVWMGVIFLVPCALQAQTAWLPFQGTGDVTVGYAGEVFDTFWVGDEERSFTSDAWQHSVHVAIEYGVTDDLALDLRVGYTMTDFRGRTFDGLDDTYLGVRYRLLNEDDPASGGKVPSVALRLGGIVEGTYPTSDYGFPVAPGDGASGGRAGLIAGKRFDALGFGVSMYGGYRVLSENVPDAFEYGVGAYKTLGGGLTLVLAWDAQASVSGPNLSPAISQELSTVDEDFDVVSVNLFWEGDCGWKMGVGYGRTIDGRNTAEKDLFRLSLSRGF